MQHSYKILFKYQLTIQRKMLQFPPAGIVSRDNPSIQLPLDVITLEVQHESSFSLNARYQLGPFWRQSFIE
jgi:hypothetical protein